MAVPIIESERLLLMPLLMRHFSQEYVDWLNDAEVNKYITSAKDYTLEKLEIFLKEIERKNILFWAIHLKNPDKHIGNIKIDPVVEKYGLCEYGIMMGDRNEWGKGYAKEASESIIEYCFESLNLRKMTLGVTINNVFAVKLYKSLGFVTEGVYKSHELYDGKFCDTLRMALFNKNYRPV